MYTYFSQYSNIVPLFFFFVPIISLVYTIGFFFTPVRMARNRDLQILTMFL